MPHRSRTVCVIYGAGKEVMEKHGGRVDSSSPSRAQIRTKRKGARSSGPLFHTLDGHSDVVFDIRCREEDVEAGPFSGLALYFDFSLVVLDNAFAD